MLKEFKEFISKGNVVELAVGLIMATYFGKIVKSLVDDIIMPVVGNLMGGVDISQKKMVLTEASEAIVDGEVVIQEAVNEVTLNYGMFINHILTFVIVAFSVFLVVKGYNNMKKKMEKKKEEVPATPPAPSKEEVLLTEIRDALRK
ncbi:MAG: large-conductance mechanosensitive channel protein MscL [Lishizhenia sp.]